MKKHTGSKKGQMKDELCWQQLDELDNEYIASYISSIQVYYFDTTKETTQSKRCY